MREGKNILESVSISLIFWVEENIHIVIIILPLFEQKFLPPSSIPLSFPLFTFPFSLSLKERFSLLSEGKVLSVSSRCFSRSLIFFPFTSNPSIHTFSLPVLSRHCFQWIINKKYETQLFSQGGNLERERGRTTSSTGSDRIKIWSQTDPILILSLNDHCLIRFWL